MHRFLIADPVFTKFSHMYMVGPSSLEYVTFKPERELVPLNNLRLTMESECLPFDISEIIIINLIDSYIKCRQLSFALPLICICKSILKRFYLKRFIADGQFEKVSSIVFRLSKMFQLLQETDDEFIDLVAYPNGHNDSTVFTMKLFCNYHYPSYPLLPWNFTAETLGTISPPSIFSYYHSDQKLPNDIVAEVITGPTQYEMVYIKGATLKGGIVEVSYLKSPVVIFQLCDLVMPMDNISPEMLCNPVWEKFGDFARLFFGPNSGVYVSVTGGLPEDYPLERPVIFEI
jgi:hypothetical protein